MPWSIQSQLYFEFPMHPSWFQDFSQNSKYTIIGMSIMFIFYQFLSSQCWYSSLSFISMVYSNCYVPDLAPYSLLSFSVLDEVVSCLWKSKYFVTCIFHNSLWFVLLPVISMVEPKLFAQFPVYYCCCPICLLLYSFLSSLMYFHVCLMCLVISPKWQQLSANPQHFPQYHCQSL